MSGKFIVIAIGMVIGLALTPVIATSVDTLTSAAGAPYPSTATGVNAGIRSLIELVPLGYVAAILLTPVYFMFKNRNGNGNGM